ncbi:hypothetical protein Tco_1020155 [Tanacetum coccineum]|uniref:Uncharacterized protein n=1 Tax=Tanacetum coccineum TaxID=301880 RepID=A0ABQ5FZ79_9ASTR
MVRTNKSFLQVQRNKVIALMNLLNQLSESLKSVIDMGSSAAVDGLVMETPAQTHSLMQRIRGSWMVHW